MLVRNLLLNRYVQIFTLDPDPKIIKRFSCSSQMSLKFIRLKNVKMPTIVGILTFISVTNTSECLKARHVFIFQ